MLLHTMDDIGTRRMGDCMEKIIYKNNTHSTIWNEKDGVSYITFPKLKEAGVLHGMSTRLGGVSKGYLGTMNLSYTRGDERTMVDENHKIFAAALGYDEKRLVFSDQVHGTRIYQVTEADCGKGITIPSDIRETDGLMTNVKNVPMITFYADCVPLLFYDPVHEVIAMAHSGWKGTVARIGKRMLEAMAEVYDTKPAEVIAAIAPSICQQCYEVSGDVAQAFLEEFGKEDYRQLVIDKGEGKYLLDLQKACYFVLTEAGVQGVHIDVTDLCTCCNPTLLFSHRASRGRRGNLGVVMMLR